MSDRRPAPRFRAEPLRRLNFFRDFAPPEIHTLFRAGVVVSYRKGELLATEGTRKQRRVLYVVLQGELQYMKRVRGERVGVVLTLHPGDVGGFLTFLNENPSPVSVRSVGRTTVLELGRRELQDLAAADSTLAVKLLRILVGEVAKRLETLLERTTATSAWALDLERHLRAFPLLPGAPVDE